MGDFFERVEQVDSELDRANIQQDPNIAVANLMSAIAVLRDLVTDQHMQIVDLNSRIEYGYTHRETAPRGGRV